MSRMKVLAMSVFMPFVAGLAYGQSQNPLDTLGSITANSGQYSNRVPVFNSGNAYTEVCFKGGARLQDLHPAGGSTNGGNCEPGDTGWLIEHNERAAISWRAAKAECLLQNMRLPELFEWQYSCDFAVELSLANMAGSWEWASNFASMQETTISGNAAPVAGGVSCDSSSWGWIGNNSHFQSPFGFRCAK